jgi:P27 family predicted phage terminase small subunit
MGKRGPAPKPTGLRLLHGDRKDRINTDEPIPDRGLPECPDGVSDEVREVWDYTVRQIDIMGMASRADRDALRAFCEAVVTHRRACALLAKSDVLVKSVLGAPVRNPAVQVQRDAAQTLVRLAQQFGLTPAARSEIRAGVAPAVPANNPFAGGFGGS